MVLNLLRVYNTTKGVDPVTPEIREQLLNLKNNEMYLRIDEIIFDCIGQSLTVEQLIQNIKTV
jgi:hypothetical protein